MKTLILLLTVSMIGMQSFAQLANSYPNDVGIENDPNVLYVEKFDDGMTNILSRYSDQKNTAGMSLNNDKPEGSLGQNSLKMTSITGGVNNGGHLYKLFTPGFDSTVYIRYYVKYPSISDGYFHHESVWFGGYNPSTAWPNPQAGTCGLGSSRLSVAYEPVWQQVNPPGMDTYFYWGDMKSYDGGSTCYGNVMITEGRTDYGGPPSTDSPTVAYDQWMCIEIMIKLNNPVTAYNGELKVWQNGVQVGYWGPGFPNGHWLKDKWYNNPNDPPFQGFRWRTDANLIINWLWFEFYHDDPNAPSSYIKFDHLVMAKEYVGPIYDATGVINKPDVISAIKFYPNPTSGQSTIDLGKTYNHTELIIKNIFGQAVFQKEFENTSSLNFEIKGPSGLYFAQIQIANNNSTTLKVLKE